MTLGFFPDVTDKTAHTGAKEALARAKYERDRGEILLGRGLDADAKEGDVFAKAGLTREKLGTVIPSGLRRASPYTGQTPEPSLFADFRCRYPEHGRYRITNSW
jgi:hypothetical protein